MKENTSGCCIGVVCNKGLYTVRENFFFGSAEMSRKKNKTCGCASGCEGEAVRAGRAVLVEA